MKYVKFIIAGIVVFLTLTAAVMTTVWAIFVGRSDHSIVRVLSDALPIPAARLGDRAVLYRDFLEERDTMRVFLASDAAREQGIVVPFDAALEENVLERLLNEEALFELAESYGVSVSDAELRAFFAEVAAAATSTAPDMGVYLLETYGWDEEEFRQNVLRPALFEQKTSIEITNKNPEDSLALKIVERMGRDDVRRYLRF